MEHPDPDHHAARESAHRHRAQADVRSRGWAHWARYHVKLSKTVCTLFSTPLSQCLAVSPRRLLAAVASAVPHQILSAAQTTPRHPPTAPARPLQRSSLRSVRRHCGTVSSSTSSLGPTTTRCESSTMSPVMRCSMSM